MGSRQRLLHSYPNPFCELQQIPINVLSAFQIICRFKDICNSVSHRGQCFLLGASNSLSPLIHGGSGSPTTAERCWGPPGSSARLGLASRPQLKRLSASRSGCEIVFAGHGVFFWERKSEVSWQRGRGYLGNFLSLPFFSIDVAGNIQEVILQEHLEKEDEILVSLAGLKQV